MDSDPLHREDRALPGCDNVHFSLHLWPQNFSHSFWNDVTTSQVGLRGTHPAELQEQLFPGLHVPGRHEATLRSLGTSALYTPEERYFYTSIYETSIAGQVPLRAPLPRFHFTPHFYVCVPAFALQAPGADGKLHVIDHLGLGLQPFYANQMNFHLSMRSAILFASWGAWMRLQELQGSHPSDLEKRYFESKMVVIAFRLQQDRLWDLLQTGQVNFWNRVYQDYHLHVTSGHLLLQPVEQATLRYFSFCFNHNFRYLTVTLLQPCPHNKAQHPVSLHIRYMHLFAGQLRNSLPQPDHYDFRVPSELVMHFRRSRL